MILDITIMKLAVFLKSVGSLEIIDKGHVMNRVKNIFNHPKGYIQVATSRSLFLRIKRYAQTIFLLLVFSRGSQLLVAADRSGFELPNN